MFKRSRLYRIVSNERNIRQQSINLGFLHTQKMTKLIKMIFLNPKDRMRAKASKARDDTKSLF